MAETWVINEEIGFADVEIIQEINFTSNNTNYSEITIHSMLPFTPFSEVLNYNNENVCNLDYGWDDEAYRTITFETAPTGDLLTWLQANGTLTPSSSPSTADKLQDLIDIKQAIKEAIENKGADLTGVDFGGYAEKIDEIPLQKEEQTKTVTEPNFSSGDVVVTPDEGKVMTKVTVVKDNNLVPENIVKDVEIFGVVGIAETVVELTQAQYDALSVYDNNTYYLIVEV